MNKEQRKFIKKSKARARRVDFVKKRNNIKFIIKEKTKKRVDYGLPDRFRKRKKIKVKE